MSLIYRDNERAYQLYLRLLEGLDTRTAKSISVVVVQHFVPNVIPFVEALSDKFKSVIVIPKPNSINAVVLDRFEHARDTNIRVLNVRREKTEKYSLIKDHLSELIPDGRFIIVDIGGYFAWSHDDIDKNCDGRLIGVVEDTENGHQKYMHAAEHLDIRDCKPVFSVARSPLKDPEDHLVGESIVYAVERILRDNNSLPTNKRCLVLGYGKIGKSVARSLSSKNVTVWVYDTDPIRRAQALSHGYYTPERAYALQRVDLIISATGQKSLRYTGDENNCDFEMIKSGCFLASVTSADDEFDFGDIRKKLNVQDNQNKIETFKWPGDKHFHLLAKGNAVNFTHNNALGPYIYMVSCEIITCMRKLIDGKFICDSGEPIQELSVDERRSVAEYWMSAFLEVRRPQA